MQAIAACKNPIAKRIRLLAIKENPGDRRGFFSSELGRLVENTDDADG